MVGDTVQHLWAGAAAPAVAALTAERQALRTGTGTGAGAGTGTAPGKVAFIGAGPGAADLITLRGLRRLSEAQVVLFDALTDPLLQQWAPQARWVDAGKRGYGLALDQAAINAMLVQEAQGHALVVRLKGGDPSVFGRLEEEMAALDAHHISYEIIPGITAALAAAADSARPLTRRGRGRSVSLTTAMTHLGRLQATRTADTEVFYMAGRQLSALSRQLLLASWPGDTAVCIVSRAGWPDAVTTVHRIDTMAEGLAPHAGRPAVVTVGAGAQAAVEQVTLASAGPASEPTSSPSAAGLPAPHATP